MRRQPEQQYGPPAKRTAPAPVPVSPLDLWCAAPRSEELLQVLQQWRTAQHRFRSVQQSHFHQDNEYPPGEYAIVKTIENAMRPLPAGVVLYHATVDTDWSYKKHWWLPASRTRRGAENSKKEDLGLNPHARIRIIPLYVRQGVSAVWAGGLGSEFDDEEEVVLQHSLSLSLSEDGYAISGASLPLPAAAGTTVVGNNEEEEEEEGDDEEDEEDDEEDSAQEDARHVPAFRPRNQADAIDLKGASCFTCTCGPCGLARTFDVDGSCHQCDYFRDPEPHSKCVAYAKKNAKYIERMREKHDRSFSEY